MRWPYDYGLDDVARDLRRRRWSSGGAVGRVTLERSRACRSRRRRGTSGRQWTANARRTASSCSTGVWMFLPAGTQCSSSVHPAPTWSPRRRRLATIPPGVLGVRHLGAAGCCAAVEMGRRAADPPLAPGARRLCRGLTLWDGVRTGQLGAFRRRRVSHCRRARSSTCSGVHAVHLVAGIVLAATLQALRSPWRSAAWRRDAGCPRRSTVMPAVRARRGDTSGISSARSDLPARRCCVVLGEKRRTRMSMSQGTTNRP